MNENTEKLVKIADGEVPTRRATVFNKTGSNPVAVALVDSTGDQITNIAGGFKLPDFDEIVVNYTDATKDVISTVIYKKNAQTVATITATYPSATQENYILT